MTPVRDALKQLASPLSDCQQRVWRLAALEPGASWAQRIALRFSGSLDAASLSAALSELVRRHATLRTVFVVVDGQPMQCVRSAGRGGLVMIDLAALPRARREQAAARAMRREGLLPFDFRRGPLMRAVLIRLTPIEHLLSLTLHHLIFDGWSRSVMFRELAVLMRAFSNHQSSPLPPLRVQYGELARAEQDPRHAARRAQRLDEVVARQRTRGRPATLPIDRPRPPYASHRAATMPFVVPDEVWQAAQVTARREGMSAFMLGLAVLAVALRESAPSGDELTFGIAVANRPSTDAQALIGAFVNIVVVRLAIDESMTMRDVLRQTRTAMLDAFAYQDVPFDRVMETLEPGTPKGSYGPRQGEPLFRVCVDFNEGVSEGSPGGSTTSLALTVTPVDADDLKSGVDFYVSFSADRDTLRGLLLYSAELYERRTAAAFVDRLQQVFAALPHQMDRALTEVPA